MRRIVTGHTQSGKSVIVDDAELPRVPIVQDLLVGEGTELWATEGTPTIPIEESDHKKRPSFGFPGPGGTRARISCIHPDNEVLRQASEKGVDLVGMWRELTGEEEFGMHTTDTIDYGIVLSGEVWLELDDGAEVHLKPGDCVVQNGTRHAWRNKGSETCVMAFVMVGAKRK